MDPSNRLLDLVSTLDSSNRLLDYVSRLVFYKSKNKLKCSGFPGDFVRIFRISKAGPSRQAHPGDGMISGMVTSGIQNPGHFRATEPPDFLRISYDFHGIS